MQISNETDLRTDDIGRIIRAVALKGPLRPNAPTTFMLRRIEDMGETLLHDAYSRSGDLVIGVTQNNVAQIRVAANCTAKQFATYIHGLLCGNETEDPVRTRARTLRDIASLTLPVQLRRLKSPRRANSPRRAS